MSCFAERQKLLDQAADFIETIPDEQFNMEHWWLPDGMAFDDWHNRMYRVADGPCGCSIGHMIQKGLFGLSKELLEPKVIPKEEQDTFRWTESSLRQAQFVQIGDTFGVNNILAEFMFDQYSYLPGQRSDKAAVVRRVRFVAEECRKAERTHIKEQ